jgi:methanethiol S-methyltransferase
MKYLLIAFIWSAYCALHSYLISTGFTKLMNRIFNKYYACYRLFYVLLSLFLLIPAIRYTVHADHEIIIHYTPIGSFIRYILTMGSLVIFFWAFFFSYDFLSFIGIRQILELKSKKQNTPSVEIKRNGLLGIVRHPMYLAVVVILWCNTFKLSDVVVNTVLTLYIIIGTRLEERKLVKEFGNVYIRYQQDVPMLIPFFKFKGNKPS